MTKNSFLWITLAFSVIACSDSSSPGAAAPVITREPSSATVIPGAPTLFTIRASTTGGGTLAYEWRLNGAPASGPNYAGASSPTLQIAVVGPADTGTWTAAMVASIRVRA